ncbi:hypothetical protein EIP86_000135 [Pleurotus ostreatoroseus]|nr:hypothetical protein EIP86_000135 [Pleurotus ostreatoroseus]
MQTRNPANPQKSAASTARSASTKLHAKPRPLEGHTASNPHVSESPLTDVSSPSPLTLDASLPAQACEDGRAQPPTATALKTEENSPTPSRSVTENAPLHSTSLSTRDHPVSSVTNNATIGGTLEGGVEEPGHPPVFSKLRKSTTNQRNQVARKATPRPPKKSAKSNTDVQPDRKDATVPPAAPTATEPASGVVPSVRPLINPPPLPALPEHLLCAC